MAYTKRALITGITGQDGSYLAELLLEKGYDVFGLVRRNSTYNFQRIEHLLEEGKLNLIEGDLLDSSSLRNAIEKSEPDEIYNLAAMSFVKASFDEPIATHEVTGLGAIRLLEETRKVNPRIKFYQASSSEMFGKVKETPQTEETPFNPQSPYGEAKINAHFSAVNHRNAYGMFVCSGILFNHESPRRGLEFVSRKITDGVAKIKYGLANKLYLGNIDAHRDWGFAGDYVKAMWTMLQHGYPDDYVIGTGKNHTVREFTKEAFKQVGIANWEDYVVANDPRYLRAAEVDTLLADASKAKKVLGWEPKVDFGGLVTMMMENDLEIAARKTKK